ncbi:hypothetical protein B0H16DRAFT_479050 [Mycena metata]|uniref:F-box domain-containing protein n=1 Tax=Mycena metata TaxID=1033252 RepID=A0AAD7KD42_9AGAR|nr:hypothetical protein B0H16DRAFT_479050 [Mycena metata]
MADFSSGTTDACVTYLMRLSYTELFHFSLTSTENFHRVSSHLQRLPNEAIGAFVLGGRSGAFQRVPLELITIIILLLPMPDRISFGATCRTHRATAGQALLTSGAAALRPYNLSLSDWRFLQSCTRSMISGIVLKRMLYIGRDCRWPPLQSVDPSPVTDRTLDIYCAKYEISHVAKFVTLATGYIQGPYTGVFGNVFRAAYTLTKADAPNINIFEVRSANPLDGILNLSTTADIGAWTLDRLWHGYPKSTFEGCTITTPTRLPMHTLEDQQHAWDVIHSNMRNGYWVDSQWPQPHSCLTVAQCPSTWRRTIDRGCLSLRFPNIPHAATRVRYPWSTFEDIAWNLGTITLCTKVWGTYRQPDARSFKSYEYDRWTDQLFILMKAAKRPE